VMVAPVHAGCHYIPLLPIHRVIALSVALLKQDVVALTLRGLWNNFAPRDLRVEIRRLNRTSLRKDCVENW
jgi:hypothetical protein